MTHKHSHTHKHSCIHSYTHWGTRLGRQLTLAPTNSEEFVVIATVKWDDFTVSRNVSWHPCRYGNITRRRKRRWRERASEPSLHSSGLLLGTVSLQCPYFLPRQAHTHRDKPVKHMHKYAHTETHTHLEKPVRHRFHLAHSFDCALTIFSYSVIVTRAIWIHYAQCQYWCNNAVPQTGTACWMKYACCQKVWGAKREERSGEEIKDIQLHRAFPCAAERVGWNSGVTIGWLTIRGATAQQLYITILYLAQSFHYSYQHC